MSHLKMILLVVLFTFSIFIGDLFGAPSPVSIESAQGKILIRLSIEEGSEEVDVRILGKGGEQVRALAKGPLGSGRHGFIWDGKNSQGILLPPGSYIADVKIKGKLNHREGFFISNTEK